MSSSQGNDLVAIGTAGDPMEAAMVREFLSSNGIECMVQGENHRSMLQAAGAFIELRILVPESQAEEATALLADFRGQLRQDEAERAETDVFTRQSLDDDEALDTVDWRADDELARRVRGARLLSLLLPGLGLGHFAAGARVRGAILLAAWPVAIFFARTVGPIAFVLVALAAVVDFLAVPAAFVEASRARPPLPAARARERRDD